MKLFGKNTHEVAQRIVTAFAEPEKLPKALAPIFLHRKDDSPCHRWSWSNRLLIALAGTSDARGIKQWNSVNRRIKAGSKAIWILVPCVKTLKERNEAGENVRRNILLGFSSTAVFAIEDTEGAPLPKASDEHAAWIRQLPFIEVAEAWNIRVDTYSGAGSNALGYYRRATTGEAIMLGVENASTWAHELVHAADQRLTKLAGERWNREIVAELGSAILLECLGLDYDADLGGAYTYIQRYAQEANKDPVRACIEVLDRTCNCVKLILDTAESHQETAVPA